MKDVMDILKKNLGMEEEKEENEDQETIIVPEQTFYEIILMKTKNLDEFDYALSQIIEEKNPIIMDLSLLEKNREDFKTAAEKLKSYRDDTGGEAILLCQNGKNVIIITPPQIKLIRK
jgi:SepF-like predicted cell division protein (DUF552 family)